MSDHPGTAYVIEILGRTLAERDQQLAELTQALNEARTDRPPPDRKEPK